MLDRYGDLIQVKWKPHEVLWLEAANTLPFAERRRAYRDIAEMCRTNMDRVDDKAHRLRAGVPNQARAA